MVTFVRVIFRILYFTSYAEKVKWKFSRHLFVWHFMLLCNGSLFYNEFDLMINSKILLLPSTIYGHAWSHILLKLFGYHHCGNVWKKYMEVMLYSGVLPWQPWFKVLKHHILRYLDYRQQAPGCWLISHINPS